MKYHLLPFIAAIFLISPSEILPQEIIIIKSSDIIPYQKAIEGFKSGFARASFQEYSINEDISGGKSIVERALKDKGDLVVAVGPEATYLVGTITGPTLKLFTMVANPEKLLTDVKLYPGVSLNLPIDLQLKQIKVGFPQRKRIGLFYAQTLNQSMVDTISQVAATAEVQIVRFPITVQKDIPEILNSPQFAIDILWIIPDRIIGSEKILKFLINQMLLKKIPVVGFNEWFAENGAILSFSLDYREIGIQTAEFASQLLQNKNSPLPLIQGPVKAGTIVNLTVAGKLGIVVSPEVVNSAREVIK
jgi:putative ABC transport system substrate-binding protein